MFEGTYSYRFDGFTVDSDGMPHHLVGVGVMVFSQAKKITGDHVSTAALLAGKNALVESVPFALDGSFEGPTDNAWAATITFTSKITDDYTQKPTQVMTGRFAFVPVGDESRFWFISTGSELEYGLPTVEIVSGEAVRLK